MFGLQVSWDKKPSLSPVFSVVIWVVQWERLFVAGRLAGQAIVLVAQGVIPDFALKVLDSFTPFLF